MGWFTREIKVLNAEAIERIAALEAELRQIKRELDNINLDLQQAKSKKRIVKDDDKPQDDDKYKGVLIAS